MWSSFGYAEDQAHGLDDASGAECVARLRRGDPEALNELLGTYWHPLVAYITHLLDGKSDAAEDIVQEAFIRLWERRTSWKEGSLPAPLLYTITRNLAVNERRNLTTRRLLGRLSPFSTTAGTTPEDDLERSELGVAIQSAIDGLPPRRREVFVLARFHGLSYTEIGEVMSITPRTVANQMTSALTELRDSLRPLLPGTDRQP